jgi:hypothetical protein
MQLTPGSLRYYDEFNGHCTLCCCHNKSNRYTVFEPSEFEAHFAKWHALLAWHLDEQAGVQKTGDSEVEEAKKLLDG